MSVGHQILSQLEGETSMPDWLKIQLQQAYKNKDTFRIMLLNQCWETHLNVPMRSV